MRITDAKTEIVSSTDDEVTVEIAGVPVTAARSLTEAWVSIAERAGVILDHAAKGQYLFKRKWLMQIVEDSQYAVAQARYWAAQR